MDRTQKAATVEKLAKVFADNEVLVVTHYSGLTVAQMTELRRKARAAESGFVVAKNKLAQRALKGTKFETVSKLFKGPTGVAYSKDISAAARVVAAFAKDNENLKILGGAMGETVLDAAGVDRLAKMPSLNELRATLIGLLQAPATKIARCCQLYSEKETASA